MVFKEGLWYLKRGCGIHRGVVVFTERLCGI